MSDNAIVLENQLPGDPISQWGLSQAPSSNIEGFTTQISFNSGETVDFKINTDATNYRIDIYRLGYYGGDGARLVASIDRPDAPPIDQPAPLTDPTTGLVDAGNWSVTDSWSVPIDAVSGVYIANLVREDGTFGESKIPFVVRNDSAQSDIVFQTSDATWQAYNTWGGHNLYDGSSAVSYNRPISITGENTVFGEEWKAIEWLEENGYSVTYITGADTASNAALLLDHKIFLSVGHDEYWSGEQRDNVIAARDAGVNLAFWSGNEIYWKTQWESGLDGTPSRTIVTYKETATGKTNPSGVWTGAWSDPNGFSNGGIPANALSGTQFTVTYPGVQDPVAISADFSQLRFWRNTAIANLQPGQTYQIDGAVLSYEFDSDLDNGFRPSSLIDLSATTVSASAVMQPDGVNVAAGTAVHNLTLYKASSGALVFSAGTIQWPTALADSNAAQAMVNLFADMGVQPQTLDPSLQPASQSGDDLPPVSNLLSTMLVGNQTTLTGIATDQGGGVVAGIEYSTDFGSTWHPANGRTNWSFNYTDESGSNGVYANIVEVRAIDDSLNLEPTHIYGILAYGNLGYVAANADVAAAGIDPLTHYLDYGASEARDPSYNFDSTLYLLHNADVAAAGMNPLQHYIEYGFQEGRTAYAAIGSNIVDGFDPEYYALANPDVGLSGIDPYQHWQEYGDHEMRNPDAYFDTQWYLSHNQDVADSGMDPLQHYMEYGWLEGRDPSSQFSTDGYLSANADVAASGMNPLQHYLEYGAYELRSPVGTSVGA